MLDASSLDTSAVILTMSQLSLSRNNTAESSNAESVKNLSQREKAVKAEESFLSALSKHGSAKSLYLYQSSRGLAHLHLEDFPFPQQLPPTVYGFEFLMNNGYNYFPMPRLISLACKEGRLDILKYLHAIEPELVPSEYDLELAAEKGWADITLWTHQLGLYVYSLNRRVATMAVNRHFKSLEQLIGVMRMSFDMQMQIIKAAVSAGILEAIEWADGKQPIEQGRQEWANLAAKNRHLPILEWLFNEFGLLPSVEFLGNATIGMLEWMQTKDRDLFNAKLVKYGAGNFELLKWVYQNTSQSICSTAGKVLAKKVGSMQMMKWLHESLGIFPSDMNWAYQTGDLEAIRWASTNGNIHPTPENVYYAAVNGHLDVIRWIHEECSETLLKSKLLNVAIEAGKLEVADYLQSILNPNGNLDGLSLANIFKDGKLEVLKWLHAHNYNFFSTFEVTEAARKGHLEIFVWLSNTYPDNRPSAVVWATLAMYGHHTVYKWLLDKYPGQAPMNTDICAAFFCGHLEMVKVILDTDPLLVKEISELEATRSSYHIYQFIRQPIK